MTTILLAIGNAIFMLLCAVVIPMMVRRFSAIDTKIEKLTDDYNKQTLTINTILEGRLNTLDNSVKRLESGQDEWSKEIRDRTHKLALATERIAWEWELTKQGRMVIGPIGAAPPERVPRPPEGS